MLNHYLTEAREKTDENDPCSYYVAFFEAFMQFIEQNNQAFGPPSSSSMISVMLFSTSDSISQKLEDHFQMDEKNGHRLQIRPISAARFLTGAMAQSARYRIAHPDEASKEELIRDMRILVEKLYVSEETH